MSLNVHKLRRPLLANAALDTPLGSAEKDAMIAAAAQKVSELFDILHIDHRHDHNTRDTPRRVARMYVEELLSGRFDPPPAITEFENAQRFKGMIVTGPISLKSTCAHHLMPIFGSVIIGILPSEDGRIIGLSKYDRIVAHYAARFQIQEELTKQIGDYLIETTAPLGLSVRLNAVHLCKVHRGVQAPHRSRMITTAHYGVMETDRAMRAEFLAECVNLEAAGTP